MEEHPCRVRSELPAERVEDDWGFRMGRTGGSTRSASGLSNTSSHTLEKRLAHVIRMSSVQRLGLSRRTLSSCVFRHSRETSRTAAESCSVHCSWVSITFMNAFVCTLLHTPASSMGSRKGLAEHAAELARCAALHLSLAQERVTSDEVQPTRGTWRGARWVGWERVANWP